MEINPMRLKERIAVIARRTADLAARLDVVLSVTAGDTPLTEGDRELSELSRNRSQGEPNQNSDTSSARPHP